MVINANNQNLKNVFLDFRGSEQARTDPVEHLIPEGISTEYVHLPLNDEDIIDLLHSKISHMPKEIQFVTMCAKGYRSLIGYSLMKLIAEPTWKIKLCRNTLPEIQKSLGSQQLSSLKAENIV